MLSLGVFLRLSLVLIPSLAMAHDQTPIAKEGCWFTLRTLGDRALVLDPKKEDKPAPPNGADIQVIWISDDGAPGFHQQWRTRRFVKSGHTWVTIVNRADPTLHLDADASVQGRVQLYYHNPYPNPWPIDWPPDNILWGGHRTNDGSDVWRILNREQERWLQPAGLRSELSVGLARINTDPKAKIQKWRVDYTGDCAFGP